MPQVTVSGGSTGHPPVALTYDSADSSYWHARAFASEINATYNNPVFYSKSSGLDIGHPATDLGSIIITKDNLPGNYITLKGFGAVTIQNNDRSVSVQGGYTGVGQTVLAGNGGMVAYFHSGNNTVIAGGGNNFISFSWSSGTSVVYTNNGNDSITGGDGKTDIRAGLGNNLIRLRSGSSVVHTTGNDRIKLDYSGSDTILASTGGSVFVDAWKDDGGGGSRVKFINANLASTVNGGYAKYTVFGGVGGGYFKGGYLGYNTITGGTGQVTIVGGGNNDVLAGGTGNDLITAAKGNETLKGGGGSNLFDLRTHQNTSTAGAGYTDVISDFTRLDLMNVGGNSKIAYALNTFVVHGSNGYFMTLDGTRVELKGVTSITAADFTKSS